MIEYREVEVTRRLLTDISLGYSRLVDRLLPDVPARQRARDVRRTVKALRRLANRYWAEQGVDS